MHLTKKQVYLFVFSTFCGLIFSVKVNCTNTVNKVKNKKINFNIHYLKDNTQKIDEIVNSNKFKKFPANNSLGKNSGTYWLKLKIETKYNLISIVSYVPTHNIDKIDIYQYSNNTIKYITSTGNSVSKKNLQLNYKFPAFNLLSNKKNNTTYFLKVKFPKEANFPIKIVNKNDFLPYVMHKKTINSIYYGTALVIIILNFFFFIKFNKIEHLYYLLFFLSIVSNLLLLDGSLINYFRGNKFYYNLEFIIHFSEEVWLLLFSIYYLDLKSTFPKKVKYLYLFPIVLFIFYLGYVFTKNYSFLAYGDAFGIILFLILWALGIYSLKKSPTAKFYVIGYLLVLPLAIFSFLGYSFGKWNVHGDLFIIKIAGWLDMIVFTYAIFFKLNHKYKENEKAILNLSEHINTLSYKKTPGNPFFILLKENSITKQRLTLREVEILKHLNEELNNGEIADKLFISKNTVKYHVKNIYSKTNVNNRSELKKLTKIITH